MAVKLVRARSFAVLPRIMPHLLDDEDGAVTKQMLVQTMERALMEDSENFLLMVALDEEADAGSEVKGFMIAYAPPAMNYVFIDQCWIDNKTDPKLNLGDAMMNYIRIWAKNMERQFVRMETKRDPRAMTRKYGFTALSTTMQTPVDIADEVIKEFSDEQKQRTEDDVHDERSSDAAVEGAVRVPEREGGTTSDGLRGEPRSTVDESVQ